MMAESALPRSSDLSGATVGPLKRYAYLGIAAVIYIAIAVFSIGKPLTLDQSDNTHNAAAIADLGFSALGQYDYDVYHPQLHEHILALFYRMLGNSSTSSRVLNMICSIIVMFFIIKISRQLFHEQPGTTIGGIAVLLYATNPFILQHSLIVDRDTTINPIAILLFFWIFIRQEDQFTHKSVLKLGALLAVCAWAKEFTPVFILAPTALYLWWRLGFSQAFSITFGIAAVGLALFIASWLIYCWSTGVPPLSFVELSIVNRSREGYFTTVPFTKLPNLLRTLLPWITPGFFILAVLAAGQRLLQLQRERFAPQPVDLLWLFAIIFWGITNFYISGITRWQFPLYAAAVIPMARYIYLMLRAVEPRQILGALGSGAAVGVLAGLVLDDPLLASADMSFLQKAIWYLSAWFAAPLAACLILMTILKLPVLSRAGALLTVLSLLVAISLAMNIKQTADYTTAPSWGRDYGEKGFYDTLEYLKAHVDDSVPVIRKDLAYYMMMTDEYGRDFHWHYNSIFRGDLNEREELHQVNAIILRPEVKFVVLDTFSVGDRQEPSEMAIYLSDRFDHVETFGGFWIYRKKGSG